MVGRCELGKESEVGRELEVWIEVDEVEVQGFDVGIDD